MGAPVNIRQFTYLTIFIIYLLLVGVWVARDRGVCMSELRYYSDNELSKKVWGSFYELWSDEYVELPEAEKVKLTRYASPEEMKVSSSKFENLPRSEGRSFSRIKRKRGAMFHRMGGYTYYNDLHYKRFTSPELTTKSQNEMAWVNTYKVRVYRVSPCGEVSFAKKDFQ